MNLGENDVEYAEFSMAQRFLIGSRNNNDDGRDQASNISRNSILEGLDDEIMLFQLFEMQDRAVAHNSTTGQHTSQNIDGNFSN